MNTVQDSNIIWPHDLLRRVLWTPKEQGRLSATRTAESLRPDTWQGRLPGEFGGAVAPVNAEGATSVSRLGGSSQAKGQG
jgi:hypothetical protein